MKTNHQRGFVESYRKYGIGKGNFITGSMYGETPLSGVHVHAVSTEASANSRGVRRDKAGAKKFVRSRTRFHEDAALKRLVRDGFDEE